MPSVPQEPRGRAVVVALALVGSAGYAWGAATTTPFTWAANVVTAIPIALVAVLALVLWPAHPERAGVEVGPAPGAGARHPYLGWVVLVAVVVGWELTEYFWRGSRSAHPTLSSMADAFDAHTPGRAVAFLAWLWLGAAIVRAGRPVAARSRRPKARRS